MKGLSGAPKTNRTSDLPLRRGLLYPLSYRGVARILPKARAIAESTAACCSTLNRLEKTC
jgi:hypothetical protein